MNNGVHYTPIEQKIMDLLADGFPHSADEILATCFDELASNGSLRYAIFNLRKKLLPQGEDLIAQSYGKHSKYRRVRLLRVSTDDT